METLLIVFPVLVFSIVLHEVAHGWVAYRQGDATAAMLGRLTLNPIPHIDPVGSILLPAMLALTGTGMILGWAKPVPVNPRNFRNYKRGDILVSLAGVTVNFLLAFAFAILWAMSDWGVRLAPGLSPIWPAAGQMGDRPGARRTPQSDIAQRIAKAKARRKLTVTPASDTRMS